MTETAFAPYRLERPDDSPFKGVCTAVADATGTDPVLWRVLIVVLSFFGGLGVALYLAGFVAIPAQGEETSILQRLVHGPDRHLRRDQTLPVILLIIAVAVTLHDSDGAIAVAVLAVVGVLWWRGRPDQPLLRAPLATTAATATTGDQPAWTAPPPRPPRPRRARSPFTGLTLSVAAAAAGVLVLVGQTTSVPAEVVWASALGIVGLGLVIGSWWGRSTGLVLVAVLLTAGLGATVAARPVLDAGVGDRTWTPTSDTHQSFRLGVGDATLDLTGLTPREAATIAIDARVDVGHLLVLVPAGLRVSVFSKVELGDLLVEGEDHNGRDVSRTDQLGPSGTTQVRLALQVRTGQVEVRHA